MCLLQITNDIEHLSSTLHGVNVTFICHPSNVENYSDSHKSETDQKEKKKKSSSALYIFTPLCQFFASKYQIAIATKISEFFQHLDNRHLTAHQTAQW